MHYTLPLFHVSIHRFSDPGRRLRQHHHQVSHLSGRFRYLYSDTTRIQYEALLVLRMTLLHNHGSCGFGWNLLHSFSLEYGHDIVQTWNKGTMLIASFLGAQDYVRFDLDTTTHGSLLDVVSIVALLLLLKLQTIARQHGKRST